MTRPISKNRKAIATLSVHGPGDLKPVQAVERSLAARIREIGLSVKTEPLREMRLQMGLDMQVVYFKIRVPIGDGVTVRLPVMATITPRFYSPTQAHHLDRAQDRHRPNRQCEPVG
jgi:hypothetical protein